MLLVKTRLVEQKFYQIEFVVNVYKSKVILILKPRKKVNIILYNRTVKYLGLQSE